MAAEVNGAIPGVNPTNTGLQAEVNPNDDQATTNLITAADANMTSLSKAIEAQIELEHEFIAVMATEFKTIQGQIDACNGELKAAQQAHELDLKQHQIATDAMGAEHQAALQDINAKSAEAIAQTKDAHQAQLTQLVSDHQAQLTQLASDNDASDIRKQEANANLTRKAQEAEAAVAQAKQAAEAAQAASQAKSAQDLQVLRASHNATVTRLSNKLDELTRQLGDAAIKLQTESPLSNTKFNTVVSGILGRVYARPAQGAAEPVVNGTAAAGPDDVVAPGTGGPDAQGTAVANGTGVRPGYIPAAYRPPGKPRAGYGETEGGTRRRRSRKRRTRRK